MTWFWTGPVLRSSQMSWRTSSTPCWAELLSPHASKPPPSSQLQPLHQVSRWHDCSGSHQQQQDHLQERGEPPGARTTVSTWTWRRPRKAAKPCRALWEQLRRSVVSLSLSPLLDIYYTHHQGDRWPHPLSSESLQPAAVGEETAVPLVQNQTDRRQTLPPCSATLAFTCSALKPANPSKEKISRSRGRIDYLGILMASFVKHTSGTFWCVTCSLTGRKCHPISPDGLVRLGHRSPFEP